MGDLRIAGRLILVESAITAFWGDRPATAIMLRSDANVYHGRSCARPQFIIQNIRFGSEAGIQRGTTNVCFTPKSRTWISTSLMSAVCQKRASKRL